MVASGSWVAAPTSPKGRFELLGCSDLGHVPIRLLRRNRTDANRATERARRGNVLVIAGTPDEQRLEIEGSVTVIDPSS